MLDCHFVGLCTHLVQVPLAVVVPLVDQERHLLVLLELLLIQSLLKYEVLAVARVVQHQVHRLVMARRILLLLSYVLHVHRATVDDLRDLAERAGRILQRHPTSLVLVFFCHCGCVVQIDCRQVMVLAVGVNDRTLWDALARFAVNCTSMHRLALHVEGTAVVGITYTHIDTQGLVSLATTLSKSATRFLLLLAF